MNDLCKKSGIYMLPLGFTGPQIWSAQEIPPPQRKEKENAYFFNTRLPRIFYIVLITL